MLLVCVSGCRFRYSWGEVIFQRVGGFLSDGKGYRWIASSVQYDLNWEQGAGQGRADDVIWKSLEASLVFYEVSEDELKS